MEDQINVAIRLPSTFARHYRQVITRYLAKGWWQLSPSERRAGFEAFNTPEAWALIDGETLFTHLAKLAEVWPQSAEVQVVPVRLREI